MTNIRKIIREELGDEWDWVNDTEPMSMKDDYVIDVSSLNHRKKSFLIGDLEDLGYRTPGDYGIELRLENVCYIYIEMVGNVPTIDWNGCGLDIDVTYNGTYKMLTVEEFNEIYPLWKKESKGFLGESNDDWIIDRHAKK